MSFVKTLCVDFDGVVHSYESGWQGADVIADEPVPGAMAWLVEMCDQGFEVCIYSSRSKEVGGIVSMKQWLLNHLNVHFENRPEPALEYLDQLKFPTEKPAAWLTIDDRAICFRGTFPSALEINSFKAWNK